MIFVTDTLHREIRLADGQGFIAKFNPAKDNKYGVFATNDKDLINRIMLHPIFGREVKAMEDNKMPEFEANFIKGSGGFAEISNMVYNFQKPKEVKPEAPKFDPKELIKYGMLKASLFKTNGEYRKDISEEQIKEYEALKLKIGD